MLHWIPDYRICLKSNEYEKKLNATNTSSSKSYEANQLIQQALSSQDEASGEASSPAAMKAQASADLQHLGILKEAFDFFDEDHSNGLYGDQLIRCLEAVDGKYSKRKSEHREWSTVVIVIVIFIS